MKYPIRVAEGFTNLSIGERSFRTAFGLGLIVTVLESHGNLGYTALLPLLAIYPLMTAALGWEPLYRWLTAGNKARSMVTSDALLFSLPRGNGIIHEHTAERFERLLVGAGLVAVPFLTEGAMQWQMVYPLIGIYPLMSAATGVDIVDYLLNRMKPELYTTGYKNVVKFTPRATARSTTPRRPTTTTRKVA